jgi:hypothetical protein
MTKLLDQALALAELGIPVFPCVPDGKVPAFNGSFHDATTDKSTIAEWWSREDYNIGVCPSHCGWTVVDIDPGGEPEWQKLSEDMGSVEATYTVRTPRDGRHYYFLGQHPSSAGRLAPHIDTRGIGGYVLVPPSTVGGRSYEVEYDHDIAAAPAWLGTRLGNGAVGSQVVTGEPIPLTDTSRHRARTWLLSLVEQGQVAIAGRGGNAFSYKVAARLIGLLGSSEHAAALLKEFWNPHCQPPWSDEEIDTFCLNAIKYCQNTPGIDNVLPADEIFGHLAEQFVEVSKEKTPRKSRYTIRREADMDKVEDVKWVIPGMIPEDSTILMIGASQTFKSFLLQHILLSVASGTCFAGSTPLCGVTIYGVLEGRTAVEGERRRAWKDFNGVTAVPDFRTCTFPFVENKEDVDDLLEQIKLDLGNERLRLIAVDTAGKAMGGKDENASTDVRSFWRVCDLLRETYGCSVVAIHHSGKDTSRGARGSSAWTADFDSVLQVTRPSGNHMHVSIKVLKHKDEADGQTWHFRGQHHGGSIVFVPSTEAEHKEIEEEASDDITAAKVGKALIARGAHDRSAGISSSDLWFAMGRGTDDVVKGSRLLDRMAATDLRAYCERTEAGLLWWFERRDT